MDLTEIVGFGLLVFIKRNVMVDFNFLEINVWKLTEFLGY